MVKELMYTMCYLWRVSVCEEKVPANKLFIPEKYNIISHIYQINRT